MSVYITNSGGSGSLTPPKAATTQIFSYGSGTYTLPTNPSPLFIIVTMVGGGGGGAGSGSSGSNGSDGTSTTFGSSFLTAGGGGGGQNASSFAGGTGGSATIVGLAGVSLQGANGNPGVDDAGVPSFSAPGASGGGTPFGGAGAGGTENVGTGVNAVDNSGSGGGGAGNVASGPSGAGGGAGGYISVIIPSPSTTYSYAIGSGGAGGAGGGSGSANGGQGGAGLIVVEEYYQSNVNVVYSNSAIAAQYTETAGGAYSSGVAINYATKVYDTANAVTTGASWVFTAPVSGIYSVKASFNGSNSSFTAPGGPQLILYKNGSTIYTLNQVILQTSFTSTLVVSGSQDISLASGDTIYVAAAGYPGSPAATGGAQFNYISIALLGTY